MGKYTADDNRSMQLNPNNERYWSSRGEEDDWDYDTEDMPTPTQGATPMFIEINNQIINPARITTIQIVPYGFDLETVEFYDNDWGDQMWGTFVNVRFVVEIYTDFNEKFSLKLDSKPPKTIGRWCDGDQTFLPIVDHRQDSLTSCFIHHEEDEAPNKELVRTVIEKHIYTWVRKYIKGFIDNQKL